MTVLEKQDYSAFRQSWVSDMVMGIYFYFWALRFAF